MKISSKIVMLLALVLLPGLAIASGQELSWKKVQDLVTLSSGSIASGDYIPVYDATTGTVKKVDATAYPSTGGAFNGTVGAITPAAGAFTTLSASSTTSLSGDVTIATGKAIETDTTTAHTALLKAYDVDGTAYKTFATLTNANTPSLAIAAPSGGSVTIDGAVIGGTTTAAGSFTTLSASTSITNAGVVQPVLRTFSDAVASGQTAKTVTATGVTASSKCVATVNEIPTNAVYLKSAAPGTDQVVVTLSGDPGASNADITVMCAN